MSVSGFFSGLFTEKKKKPSGPSLVEQINRQMQLLVEKSGNLNDLYGAEKKSILALAEEAAGIKDSDEILAAKLEQDILGRITAVSSACELAIAGKQQDAVKKEINSLKAKLGQRSALK